MKVIEKKKKKKRSASVQKRYERDLNTLGNWQLVTWDVQLDHTFSRALLFTFKFIFVCTHALQHKVVYAYVVVHGTCWYSYTHLSWIQAAFMYAPTYTYFFFSSEKVLYTLSFTRCFAKNWGHRFSR